MQKPGVIRRRVRHFGGTFANTVLLGPYALLFLFFIAAPIIVAVVLSFTYFNMVSTPEWNGLANYIKAFTQDDVLMRNVLPNMIVFSVVVGAVGFILQFLLAWSLAQISRWPRTILALIFYSPSMTAGVTLSVVWKVLFAGMSSGISTISSSRSAPSTPPSNAAIPPVHPAHHDHRLPLVQHGRGFPFHDGRRAEHRRRNLRGRIYRRGAEPFPGDSLHHRPLHETPDAVRRGHGHRQFLFGPARSAST